MPHLTEEGEDVGEVLQNKLTMIEANKLTKGELTLKFNQSIDIAARLKINLQHQLLRSAMLEKAQNYTLKEIKFQFQKAEMDRIEHLATTIAGDIMNSALKTINILAESRISIDTTVVDDSTLQEVLEEANIQRRLLKAEISKWTSEFVDLHGREPTKKDKKMNPEIRSMFDNYFQVIYCRFSF